MDDRINFSDLRQDSRAKVYLSWAALTAVGYVATHFYQNKNINFVWFVLSAIGLAYMYKIMPLKVRQMKRIFMAWAVPIFFGIGVSIVAVRTDLLPNLVPYLGVFWLLVQVVAFAVNGLVDRPALWYFVAAGLNAGAAALCYFVDSLLEIQYLVAAIVTVWSMLNLWIFRTEV